MRLLTDDAREVLDHIEYFSHGGRVGTEVPEEWEREANESIVLGLSIKDNSGRRLTVSGRNKLHDLSAINKKLLRFLHASPKWTVIRNRNYNGNPQQLAHKGLIHCRQVGPEEYACKLTVFGYAWASPPDPPTATHVITVTYANEWGRRNYKVEFSGDDEGAENQARELANVFLDLQFPSVSVRHIDGPKRALFTIKAKRGRWA